MPQTLFLLTVLQALPPHTLKVPDEGGPGGGGGGRRGGGGGARRVRLVQGVRVLRAVHPTVAEIPLTDPVFTTDNDNIHYSSSLVIKQ